MVSVGPILRYFCCYRHHTNPVGTEWRWKMDDPQTILQGALDNHYQMVKQFKGEF
jgi:tRNA wybutosine-synthesizing protein 1